MAKENNALLRLFPAFGFANYRYYFVGQLVSRIGTWLQIVAQEWLVLQLTNSAFLIGLVAACATLPSLLFSLFAGVIVDRFPMKKIIIVTQFLSMILALILAFLTLTHLITVWEVALLAFLLGVVNAVDMPARQAFVVEMVEKDKVASAIALNSSIYNAARVVGPSMAGILIALVGVGGAFLLNGLSYIAAVIVQFLIVPIVQERLPSPHPMKAIKEGVVYTWRHPLLRNLIYLTAVVSIFGWSYATIMPLMARQIFHQDAAGLGYLFAAAGLGSLAATLIVSAYSERISSTIFIIGGNTLFAVSMIAFTFTTNLWLAYIFLFFAGFGLLSEFSIINARVQHLVEHSFRGRVTSVYLLMFVGLFPIGNFQIGFVSEHLGTEMGIRIGAIIVLVFGIFIFSLRQKVAREHAKYLSHKETEEGIREVMRDAR